jgi:hypothetical protein
MNRIVMVVWIVSVGAIFESNAWSQATAQISGTVRDPSGAVLPGVEITATQTSTGISRSTVSNETGAYLMPNVIIGPYRIEAALPGFRTSVQTGIVLQVNDDVVINPVLEIGQVSEQVEVTANAAQVETRSTAVGQVMENTRILELPLNGRQVTDLITLSGAAVQTGVGSNQSMPGGVLISIAGGLSLGVGYYLDGAMHSDPYEGANHPMPFPDALQEFKVEASGLAANSGMRSGGAVNAVTKSGTNDFHGDLFEFVRNYEFNARNFFAARRDSLKRNQYGGTLGGPIRQNKLFFFGGYQGTKTRSDPGTTFAFVPTSAMLNGDFRTFASAACNAGKQINLAAPFVGNQVNPALFSKPALNITAKLPKAQDDCGKITYGLINKIDEYQAVGKVDYQTSAKHSLFGRYLITAYQTLPPLNYAKDNILTSTNAGFDNLAQSYALGSTYLLSPTTVNAFRLTVNRTAIARVHEPNFSAPSVGVKSYSVFPDFIVLNITGGFNLGGSTQSLATFRTTTYQVNNDVSMIKGNHQTALGVTVAHWRVNQFAHTNDPGNYAFNGTATGLGMGDFLLGKLTTMQHGSQVAWGTHENYFALYLADVWKVNRRLTVNYGARWEPFLPLKLTLGIPHLFDDDRFARGIHSKVYPNAPAGLYFPGDDGFPTNGSEVNNKWGIFNPRLGLAWDPRGNGRTSIRASFGMATDFTKARQFGSGASAPPWGFQVTVTSPPGGFEDPWAGYPGGMPVPYDPASARFTPFAQFLPVARPNMQPPYNLSRTLSIQHQFSSDWLASASYIGSNSAHLWVLMNRNNAVYIPGGPCTIAGVAYSTCSTTANTNQRRRLFLANPVDGGYYGLVTSNGDDGTSNYNGMLLSIQRRAGKGAVVGANYTYSHCIAPATVFSHNSTGGSLLPNNRNFDQGNCDSDRRQVLNLTSSAETPQFSNSTVRMLGTGWRLSGIYRFSTGDFMTIATGLDRALTGEVGNQRARQVNVNPFADRNSLTYLNINAFEQPVLGTVGNMRPGNIVGPSYFSLDLALARNFQVRENQRFEFRAEAFNITNSLRRMDPTASLNSNTFGQIRNALDPRIMQFALKYVF